MIDTTMVEGLIPIAPLNALMRAASDGSLAARLVNTLLAAAIAWLLFRGYRWIAVRSSVLGRIVGATIVLRLTLGVALFWISFLRLPFALSLQIPAGLGFWQGALDARGYYLTASDGAYNGWLYPLASEVPAPLFVNVLALWLMAVGESPAAGLFLNACLYVLVSVVAVRVFAPTNDWRRDLPCITFVACISFSPALLLHSSQPLKEEFTTAVLCLSCLAMPACTPLFRGAPDRRSTWRSVVLAALAAGATTYVLGGVRWYLAYVVIGALALTFFVLAMRWRTTGLVRCFAGSAAILAVALLGFLASTGTVYAPSRIARTEQTGLWRFPSIAWNWLRNGRTGFLAAGGGTNMIVAIREDGGELGDIASAVPQTAGEHVRAAAIGAAALTLPISAFQALTGVTLSGGRGMLRFTDLDTVVQVSATVFAVVVLWRRRRGIGDRLPLAVYALTFSATLFLALAYVVTNFGTLWRMRPLALVPLWLTLVAVSPGVSATRATLDDDHGLRATA
jgi:hypothetical protein